MTENINIENMAEMASVAKEASDMAYGVSGGVQWLFVLAGGGMAAAAS